MILDFGYVFEECRKNSSGEKRYLIKEMKETVYCEKWKLYALRSLMKLVDKGMSGYDAMG